MGISLFFADFVYWQNVRRVFEYLLCHEEIKIVNSYLRFRTWLHFRSLSILLHDMTVVIGLSSFFCFDFQNFRIFSVVWINEVNSSQSSSILEFWLLAFFPFLFFRFWETLSIFVHPSDHTWSDLQIIWSFVNLLSESHVSFWRISFNRMNFVKSFHKSHQCLLGWTFL